MLRAGLKSIFSVDRTLSVSELVKAKRVALRRGIWFKVLNLVERAAIDLTTRYVDIIRSAKLAKVLMDIVNKLVQITERAIDQLVRTVGVPLAQKVSRIAISWGNYLASKWAEDANFALYLTFNTVKA